MRSLWKRRLGPMAMCLVLVGGAWGEEIRDIPPFPRVPATPPESAAATLKTLHGFTMQPIATEPLIADPVDVAYDEEGRALVVEMRDYPYPEEKGAKPTEFPGRVTMLEDRDGDGVFDNSHVYADQLSWPTSVACWKGGIFVGAAPDIWYFKDENGDHRADLRRRVYTGFSRDNVQAIMNGLRWGLDNRIYGAASGNGGSILAADPPAGRPAPSPISVTRHDFRFDPATETLEAIPGGARFGNAFDDWGHRFVCNIRNPVQQVMVSASYFAKNPLLAPPPVIRDIAESGDQLPVFGISPPEAWRVFRAQRWSAERVNFPRSELVGAGYWTSSSGVTVYRGSAYPEEYHGNVFVGEVAGNLVHRQRLEPRGVSFVSQRADENSEFVASTDIWFRPVNFANAPDGTLHVLDMYRETIEHPWSIPDDIKVKLDLRSGNDRGRIYRLAPPTFQFPGVPKLSRIATVDLVPLLSHPNGWQRETAQRLLYERQDAAAVEPLRAMLRAAQTPPLGRLHALYALSGLKALREEDLRARLNDAEAGIREHAIRLCEPLLPNSAALREEVARRVEDDAATVRFQLALSLSRIDDESLVAPLAAIAARDGEDEWIRAAVLNAAYPQALAVLERLLARVDLSERPGMREMVRELSFHVAAGTDPAQVAKLLDAWARVPAEQGPWHYALAAGLGRGLERRKQNFADLPATANPVALARLAAVRGDAARIARDEERGTDERLAALDLFRFAPPAEARPPLAACLNAREPIAIQLAAVRLMRLWPDDESAATLIRNWKSCSAAPRQEAVEALLSRADWTTLLLTALEAGEIQPGQLTIPQRGRLVNSTVAAVKERAVKLLGPAANSARDQVIQSFRGALALVPDRTRGEAVCRRECLTCHRIGSLGHDVGPNLNTIRHRSAEEILVHVLDPNRDVPPQFISQSLQLRDGRVLTGLLASESDSSLELLRAENVRETVLRRDIEEIVSTGKSLMPEGIEQKLTPQDLADLIAYLLDR